MSLDITTSRPLPGCNNFVAFDLDSIVISYGGLMSRRGTAILALSASAVCAFGVGTAALVLFLSSLQAASGCGSQGAAGAGAIALGPPGSGQLVGATEYGGPGDPSSGIFGARGDNLLEHPDTYAELGGLTWQTATAMGGLAYMTPLRVTWGAHSAIGYKRDFGLGGGPIDGLPRVIDLWYEFAGSLGIPYESGLWSGPVRVARPPAAGSGNVLGQSVNLPGAPSLASPGGAAAGQPAACTPGTAGWRASDTRTAG